MSTMFSLGQQDYVASLNALADTVENSVHCVDYIVGLSESGLTDGQVIFARYRQSSSDLGGGLFTYYASNSTTVDNGVVFSTAEGNGRLIRHGWTAYGFTGQVHPEWWGAIGGDINTTVNDGPALQSAINYVQVYCGSIWLSRVYGTAQGLLMTSGCEIVGPGWGDDNVSATEPTAPVGIKWTGGAAPSATILQLKADTVGKQLYGARLNGFMILGYNTAGRGLHMSSPRICQIGDLWVSRCTVTHVEIDDSNGALAAGIRIGQLRWHAGSNVACANARGFVISGIDQSCTQFYADILTGTTANADTMVIGDIDSSDFRFVQASSSGAGYGVRFIAPDGIINKRPARKVKFGWFAGGDIYAEDGAKAIVEWVNSEGTTVTVSSGASLDYNVIDRRNGQRFASVRNIIDDKKSLALAEGIIHNGTPVFGTVSGQGVPAWLMPDSSDTSLKWSFRQPREWAAGKVVSFDLILFPVTANTGPQTVRLGVGGVCRALNRGLGAVGVSKQQDVTIDTSGATVGVTIVLDTPINIGAKSGALTDSAFFWFRIDRLGTSATDTYVGNIGILDVRVNYIADVANSDRPGQYRYTPSPDVSTVT